MKRRVRFWLRVIPATLLTFLLMAIVGLFISNQFLPEGSTEVERLNTAEKARLAEAIHLRRRVGDVVWPGWDEAPIPLVVFNEEYAFLVDYPGEPPLGWQEVPDNRQHGGPWEVVPDDTFQGDRYYRQPLPADGSTPQAFTVRVGESWAASLQTKEWMDISLAEMFKEQIPGFLRPFFPYRLAINLFLGGSDKYVSVLLHETFHAFEGQTAEERVAESERSVRRRETTYPWHDETMVEMWQAELDLLRDAVQAETTAEQMRLAQLFLEKRGERREVSGLSAQEIRYEQEREWLEGLAKYVELEVWRQGAETSAYEPDPVTDTLPDFRAYATYATAWEREVEQITRMADDEGDGRFYYSGLAQAKLLDTLRPGWKELALTTGLALEELIDGSAAAAQGTSVTEPTAATAVETQVRTVDVFFGNSRLNPESDCSAVVAVTRTVPAGEPASFAALEALFSGPTPVEEGLDYHSWFSDETANALLGLKIGDNGAAYVNLADIRPVIPNASTSCGSAAFLAQMESTLKAAEPQIRRVIYAIEGEPRPFYDWIQMGCSPDNDNCDPEPFR